LPATVSPAAHDVRQAAAQAGDRSHGRLLPSIAETFSVLRRR
jgi:hypothetical protein